METPDLRWGLVRGREGRVIPRAPKIPRPVCADELVQLSAAMAPRRMRPDDVRAAVSAYLRATGTRGARMFQDQRSRPGGVIYRVVAQLCREGVSPARFVAYVCGASVAERGRAPFPEQVFSETALGPWLEEYRRRHANVLQYEPRPDGQG